MGDSSNRSDRSGGAARLVWVIVALAVGTGLVALCVVLAALAGVRAERARAATMRDATDGLIAASGKEYGEARQDIDRLLAGQPVTDASRQWALRLGQAMITFAAADEGADADRATEQLRAFVTDLGLLEGRCAAWRERTIDSQAALVEKKQLADASLAALRATMTSADGAHRLDLAVKVRRFRAGGAAGDQLAREILDGLVPAGDFSELFVELSDLGLLCERLSGEDQIDRLTDLKDNLFAAELRRAQTLVRRCAATAPTEGAAAGQALAQFEAALFGTGYRFDSEHQTIRPGPDGLYSLCQTRLELRRDRERLRAEVEAGRDRYAAAYGQLNAFADALKDRSAAAAEARLAGTWRMLLIAVVGCALVMGVLGRLISDKIRRQIEAVQEATLRLGRSNAQMAAIHATSLDGVLVLDQDWKVVEFNPAAEQKFGLPRAQALGRPLAAFVAPNAALPADVFANPAGAPETARRLLGSRFEAVGERADGARFPVELAITCGASDGPPFYVVSARDLSERKRAEAEHEQLHSRLLAASRQAGMAEVATGVLHNVGNVLNSVNVSASVISDRLRRSEIPNLGKAGGMISEHLVDLPRYLSEDARGRHLPQFLVEVARSLAEDQEIVLKEMQAVAHGLDHIKHVIAAQQSHAKRGIVLECVKPDDLLDMAAQLQRESFQRHHIRVERRPSGAAEVRVDRHKVLQILVNLTANAKNAVCEGREADRVITLSAELAPAGSGRPAVARFVVQDNGVGIAAENLARIFAHGFTTRKEGHGFGLHSAANAARELGGRLRATSPGLGQGATFELEVPISPDDAGGGAAITQGAAPAPNASHPS